jgi:alkylation response protein AidB-like acyl-CoA dehydrogenase
MAQLISDRRDVDFVLHEQFMAGDLCKSERFAEFDRKTIDLVVSEARNLAVKELLPTQKAGDEQGARFDNGRVRLPECFHRAYKLFCRGEWVAMPENPKWGGQGMPKILSLAASEYFVGANCAFMVYPGLTHSAGRLIETFGTENQKQLYLKKLYSGKWTGTMLLTEPQAGSDVGALTTSAKKNADGTYSITGNKIFISAGDHDLAENIIHPVLARIEGAPEGTRGISLFLVPKIWVNPDGSPGETNDVVCTGIEEKMGIHGTATCSLALGSAGRCRGTLLGDENKGVRAMFIMMNEARLMVGLQGFSFATSAYMYALSYARERVQGKHLLKANDPQAPPVPIIQHPDIRRLLMTMKVYVEGMRSLLYFISILIDRKKISKDSETETKIQGIIDLLIPIAKGYLTDRAFEVCNHGLQVYGGYGYIREYPMEQLVRDCRITMIYEGTNGIQAMDLLGRKLGQNNGRAMMDLLGEMKKTLADAKRWSTLEDEHRMFETALNRLAEAAMHIGGQAKSPNVLSAFAFAYPFMEASGDVVLAWMLLWRAAISARALKTGAKPKDAVFYEGQLKSARFYMQTLVPVTLGKIDAIMKTDNAAVEISEAAFGG